MSKMIQIRNVPDDVHKKLKAKAARQGLSLSEMLLREATLLAGRPTFEELSERISRREPVNTTAEEIVQIIREARGPLPGQ